MKCNHRGCWALYPKAWDQDKGLFPYIARSLEALRRRKTCQICALKGSLAAGGGVVGAGGRVSARPKMRLLERSRGTCGRGKTSNPGCCFNRITQCSYKVIRDISLEINRKPGV